MTVELTEAYGPLTVTYLRDEDSLGTTTITVTVSHNGVELVRGTSAVYLYRGYVDYAYGKPERRDRSGFHVVSFARAIHCARQSILPGLADEVLRIVFPKNYEPTP